MPKKPSETKRISYVQAHKMLSQRESTVLDFVEKGYTNVNIADELGISVRTVETHRYNICKKLDISGPNGLLKWILRVRNGT